MLDFIVTWDGTVSFSKVLTGCYKIAVINRKIRETVKQRTQQFGNVKKVDVVLQEISFASGPKICTL